MIRSLLIAASLVLSLTAQAETSPVAPVVAPAPAAPSSSLDTNKDGKVDAAETAAATNAEATTGEAVSGVAEVADAAKALKDPSVPKGLAIALLLGAIFKLLLSSLKMVSKFTPWFKSAEGRRVLKYSTLGLGGAAALTANLAFGMGWIDALTIMLSGPLAVAIHEYTSDSKSEAPKA